VEDSRLVYSSWPKKVRRASRGRKVWKRKEKTRPRNHLIADVRRAKNGKQGDRRKSGALTKARTGGRPARAEKSSPGRYQRKGDSGYKRSKKKGEKKLFTPQLLGKKRGIALFQRGVALRVPEKHRT